jgi:CheY-like chemotaxis protein/nitrogen-specific signal transduction histidine kinase
MAEEAKRPVRILMLEDSPLDAELAVARLEKADLAPEVTLAANRAQFEQALQARPYDLILADYALPDFDGMAALALTREKLGDIPLIFISGRLGEEVAIDTLQRGATDYVLKHRLERLVPAVLRALKESEEHTTRVQAEAMFRQSELRFRQVIDAVPQMIWIAAPDCKLSYSNQAWKDLVPDGTTHWPDRKIFHPEDYGACMDAWAAALERNEPFTIEVRLLRRTDRTWRWHLFKLTPIAASGDGGEFDETEGNWLGTATDLQDQKLNEEALRTAEKLSVTGRMAAAIAHEINNPLESLTNLLFLIRLESEGNEGALQFLDMTENELERISSITKQTLQFYRDPSMPVEVDARQILDEVLRLFATRLAAKRIETTLHVEPGIAFEAIKGEIRQVLINLVNNAIDAVGACGRIDVEARPIQHESKPGLEMLVHDNGSGIAPEQAENYSPPSSAPKAPSVPVSASGSPRESSKNTAAPSTSPAATTAPIAPPPASNSLSKPTQVCANPRTQPVDKANQEWKHYKKGSS